MTSEQIRIRNAWMAVNELYRKHQHAIAQMTLSQWSALARELGTTDRDCAASMLAKREARTLSL